MDQQPKRATVAVALDPGSSVFRPELQGLRALAALLVVVYHVWFNRVSGGVDVFFFVTGFLLTGQLVRAAERGRIRFRAQWARNARRLLPAATTVLSVTVVAGILLLPEGRWAQTVREVVASLLFLENWQLAADAVDYSARSNTTSVVQHFWSLSIQAQVMLLWPLMVALVALTARGAMELRGRLAVTLLGLTAASLTYSIALTSSDQQVAYFHTLTRLWEFSLGGLLALVIGRISLTRGERAILGWVGVVGLLLCGAVLPGASVFPGFAALWPTGCAAAILVAGTSQKPTWGADRFLTARPMRYLGDLSYPLYLWHWPVLMFTLVVAGQNQLGFAAGLAVIAVSLVLAALTHHLVERPIMAKPGPVRLRRPAIAVICVLLLAGSWQGLTIYRSAELGEAGDPNYPGALTLSTGFDPAPAPEPLPPMVSVYDDWVRVERWHCAPMPNFPSDVCHQPVDYEPERRIVLVGDSHVQQYAGALLPVAQRREWQLVTILRGACPFSTASEVDPDDTECVEWTNAAAEEIARLQPDAVVTLASRNVRAGLTEVTPRGFVDRWWQLHELGIPVLAIRDNPRFDFSPPDCLQQRGRAAPECGVERAAVYAPVPPWTVHSDIPPNVTFLDLSDQLCTEVHCPAEIGNVLVYMDDNHLTASYAATMAYAVDREISSALSW